ncbi:MAG TPA: 7-carboxy-7-deazaguanine synthase QueE [Paludibacter sp.]|nr:7-carboxy-7-deazaguanine synthase QueE [Paludibacter sp.]
MKLKLKVVEIFNSIQGEGANVGRSATFIRLSNCNKNCSFCDTDWSGGVEMTIGDVLAEVRKHASSMIIWTGGEPTLQLTSEILNHFKDYYQAIETNGTNPVPEGIDYVSCSPKVGVETLNANFQSVGEFRFPVVAGDEIPSIDDLPRAKNYFLSPVFDGELKRRMETNRANLDYCLSVIAREPRWRLSVQLHKLLDVQ